MSVAVATVGRGAGGCPRTPCSLGPRPQGLRGVGGGHGVDWNGGTWRSWGVDSGLPTGSTLPTPPCSYCLLQPVMSFNLFTNENAWDVPGSSVVRPSPSTGVVVGLNPGRGAKNPDAHDQKTKT